MVVVLDGPARVLERGGRGERVDSFLFRTFEDGPFTAAPKINLPNPGSHIATHGMIFQNSAFS